MSFKDWLNIYMPRYWDVSKKRVQFTQFPKYIQEAMKQEYQRYINNKKK